MNDKIAQQRTANINGRLDTVRICSEPYCYEPSWQNTRKRSVTDSTLCKKHRGKVYKIRHRKKSEQLATELETFREIFSGSPEPIPCQSLPQLLEEIMQLKRLELIKQPSLKEENNEFLQYRQQYDRTQRDKNYPSLPTIKRSNSKTESRIHSPTDSVNEALKPLNNNNKQILQATTISKNPYDRVGVVDESLINQVRNEQKNASKMSMSSSNTTKSAFYQTKAGGPNALRAVRSGTIAQSISLNSQQLGIQNNSLSIP